MAADAVLLCVHRRVVAAGDRCAGDVRSRTRSDPTASARRVPDLARRSFFDTRSGAHRRIPVRVDV